jgi:hypothetical protein
MKTLLKSTVLTVAAAAMAVPAVPAAAVDLPVVYSSHSAAFSDGQSYHRGHRDRYRDRRGHRYDDRYYGGRGRYHDERIYRNTRVWRGHDGRYYCRKSNGTTGLIIGAAGGALLGRSVDTYGDRTTGTVLGAALGALLGREVDRSSARCR